MSEVAERLTERRNNVWHKAKELADRAADENRNFSGEEESQWAALNSELEALDRRITSVIEGEQRAKDAEESMSRLRGEAKRTGPADSGSDELCAFFRGDGPRVFTVMPGSEQRDLSKLTAGAGLNTVQTSFYNQLVAHMIETSAVMSGGATVLTTASGEKLQVPKTTSHSSASIITEGSAISESDPAFGQVELGSFKYGTLIQASRELLTDTGVDLEGYLAMQAGRALGNAFGAHVISGTGSGQPRGILTDASSGVTGPVAVAGGFGDQSAVGEGADLLIDLFHSVIAPYRASNSCRWIMDDSTAGVIRKIKTTEGQYIWQPSVVAGTPDMILNKPVLTDPSVPAVAADAKSVIFGDLSQYFVRLAGGIRFERSDDYAFNSDLVTFRAVMRADGALVDLTGAVKVFAGGAAA